MVRIAVSLTLLFLVVCFPGCDAGKSKVPKNTTEWVTHKDENLSVKLPFKPKLQTQDVKHPLLGNINFKIYTCKISGDKALLVSQVKYPVDPKLYNVAAGLKGAVSGMVTETKGTIESESDIKIGSIPGKQVVVAAKSNLVAKSRVFIDGNGPTLYQFQAIGKKGFIDEKVVSDFFDSIEITPIAAGKSSGNSEAAKKNKAAFEK